MIDSYNELYFKPGNIELDGVDIALEELTRINRQDINGELERLPYTITHIGQIEIGLDLKIGGMEMDIESAKSRKYMELRELKATDKTITEDTIKARLKDDSDLQGMTESLEDAKAYRKSLSNTMAGLYAKKDALLRLAARDLEEFKQQEYTVGTR